MLGPRKRPFPLLIAFTVALIVFFYRRDANRIYWQWASSIDALSHTPPANKTLGFGAILVVSKEGSERRHSLLQAANVTDIDLTIPAQPKWSQDDVDKFRNNQHTDEEVRGSILAWLGHRHALKWFLESGLETALILEDDVDWDIRLRSVQIPLAARAARSLLPPARSYAPIAQAAGRQGQYWGDPKSWDLLYIGHCGDYFGGLNHNGLKPTKKPHSLNHVPHATYHDPSLLDRSDLHPFTQQLFNALELPEHTRAFHRSKFPLCSFGYAVTRAAAERLLDDLAPPKLRPNGPKAYDVALLHACMKGSQTPSPTPKNNPKPHPDPQLRHKYASPGLRCWTLNSELFHHMPGNSQIAKASEEVGFEIGIPPVDLAAQQQVSSRQETINIGCGFWGGAFSFDANDTDRLAWLQEQVGRKGKCLKGGRDSA